MKTANLNTEFIYGIDSGNPIEVSANVHNLLVVDELIQYDGKRWLYFDDYSERIKNIQKEKGI